MSDAEQLAKLFHEAYERLAPKFGYQTRPESAVPWEEVPEANRQLMVAVVGEVFGMPPKDGVMWFSSRFVNNALDVERRKALEEAARLCDAEHDMREKVASASRHRAARMLDEEGALVAARLADDIRALVEADTTLECCHCQCYADADSCCHCGDRPDAPKKVEITGWCDTGWRDRPPTREERKEHAGSWILLSASGGVYLRSLLHGALSLLPADHVPGDRWRPVTDDLWPAPWPEVPCSE